MKIAYFAAWYIAVFAGGWLTFRTLRRTLENAGHVRQNFLGRNIPTSMGAGFVLLMIMVGLADAVYRTGKPSPAVMPILIIVLGFGFLGILDDLVVRREPGGIKGHLSKFGAGGGVSTALIKAFFGLALSLLVSIAFWLKDGWIMAFVNGLVVALAANSINMLDVRPGRAVKGFLFVCLIIIGGTFIGSVFGDWARFSPETLVFFVPFVIWTVTYAGMDFSCRAMLGDAGSNILGAAAGMLAVYELSPSNRWICLAVLIWFHLVCEAVSLTALIDRVSFLKKLDLLLINPRKE